MFNSILTESGAEVDETPPRSGLPWVWVGFVFAVVFLLSEFLMFVPAVDQPTLEIVFVIIVLAAMAYWFFCIHRFHKVLNEMAPHGYSVTPAEAVGKHFIPVLNLIWIFSWPSTMTDYINERGRVRMFSGKLIGLLLLLSFLLRFVDGAVGLACTFGISMYIWTKLRRHIELLKGASTQMLPPPPDRELFGYVPDSAHESKKQTGEAQ